MNDDTIISLAIERSSRSRYRDGLSRPEKRRTLLDKLNHCPPLDPRYTKRFSSFVKAIGAIKVKPDAQVYILSASEEIDGKHIAYEDAISLVRLNGFGTIICISPSLAVYYAEEGESAAIIQKPESLLIKK